MMGEPRRRTAGIRRLKIDRRYYTQRDPEERRKLPTEKYVHKILVTGDRDWDDIPRVVEELRGYRPGTILVHGACRGADIICAAVAEALRFEVRAYPADWKKYPRAAGPIRNQQMLDEEHKTDEPIDLVLAFHNNIENSRGTADMLDRVVKTGLPWRLCTSSDNANSSDTGSSSVPAHADLTQCTGESDETTDD